MHASQSSHPPPYAQGGETKSILDPQIPSLLFLSFPRISGASVYLIHNGDGMGEAQIRWVLRTTVISYRYAVITSEVVINPYRI